MNLYLALAILSTILGPVFYLRLSSHSRLAQFIDGLILTTLVGLIALHILPESLERSGPATMLAVVLGLIGPVIVSRITKKTQCEIQKPFLVISVLGFFAHNMLDGAALVIHPNQASSGHLLALAVIIHRFLVSMALWQTLSRSLGRLMSALSLAGLSLAMVSGYFFADQILTRVEADVLHILQSLACGMLFHVLLHPHHVSEVMHEKTHNKKHGRAKSHSLGAFCGLVLALLAYLFWPAHSHLEPHFADESVTHETIDR